ncbi:fatty acyl-AMP ligase [Streptomyces pulveraceus]|uniref:Fatty acyl-AMP ligase n=1 Tax=Streptomyces pulveraceus TaxID=68258 RepID=A0ABW1GXU0_9ACTN
MLRPGSIIDVVRSHAERQPDETAYSFLAVDASGLHISRQLSYGELDANAAGIAAVLRNSHEPGDRVLLACPPGPDFVVSFLGALYADVVPVPAPLPSGNKGQQARVHGIMTSAGVSTVLTDERNFDEVRDRLAGSVPEVSCLSAGRAGAGNGRAWRPPAVDPDRLAFLQYTSGSTSDPRGVMVSHANLVENLGLIQRSYGVPDGARVGGWLPPYHDMGLMGTLLLPLFIGGQGFLMAPSAFLRRPAMWLEMIDKHDVAFSPAPNFAYDLCVRRVSAERAATLDLSRWRWAVNGAEPVQNATVRNFVQHFASAGLRPEAVCPSYGMAETTLFVSGSPGRTAAVVSRVDAERFERHRFTPAGQGEEARLVVSSGPVSDGFDLRIVDPDSLRELADGEIGEIWLRGPSVARGYWRQEEETERSFRARTASGAGPFLRTGDLGVRHEGELYVTGRIKEVLILNGRNIYPQDIEREAREQHPACADGVGAAFTVTVDGGSESVVLVQEIRWSDPDEGALRDLARGVMAGLSASIGVPVGNVVFVRPGAVLRSTSGKVQRVAMRRLFEDAALTPVTEELDAGVRRTFRAHREDAAQSGGPAAFSPPLAQSTAQTNA